MGARVRLEKVGERLEKVRGELEKVRLVTNLPATNTTEYGDLCAREGFRSLSKKARERGLSAVNSFGK